MRRSSNIPVRAGTQETKPTGLRLGTPLWNIVEKLAATAACVLHRNCKSKAFVFGLRHHSVLRLHAKTIDIGQRLEALKERIGNAWLPPPLDIMPYIDSILVVLMHPVAPRARASVEWHLYRNFS